MVYSGTRVPKMAMCRARITPSLEPEVSLHRIYTSGGNSGRMADISSLHGWRIWSHLTAFRFFSLFAYEFRICVYLTFFYIIPAMNSASREGCDTLTK